MALKVPEEKRKKERIGDHNGKITLKSVQLFNNCSLKRCAPGKLHFMAFVRIGFFGGRRHTGLTCVCLRVCSVFSVFIVLYFPLTSIIPYN